MIQCTKEGIWMKYTWMDEYRFIDLESEMDVLRDMLKSDGLIDETQDDDPFSQVLGGH